MEGKKDPVERSTYTIDIAIEIEELEALDLPAVMWD